VEKLTREEIQLNLLSEIIGESASLQRTPPPAQVEFSGAQPGPLC